MPTYDYACEHCGGFEALRPSGLRDEPAACPDCGSASPRVLSAAPRLALMASGTRRAIETNERARHEPVSSRDYARLRHPAGCGCCGSGKRGATVTAPNGAKAAPSRRPWMISH
ncbi:zinc ribbon domain-containing protein [Variovorax sp. tm]|uniref:zinc ribbon domain-containing protein n=1 Tax=Variovorax atrisoli TaxID=3394203 RepID=UPI003A801285